MKRRPVRNFRLELLRKAVHVLFGIGIVLGLQGGVLTLELLGLLIILFGLVVVYNYRQERELLTRVVSLNRADAAVPGLDVLAYMVGCWIAVFLFSPPIAAAAILILAFADPVAHIIGTGFGGSVAAITPYSTTAGLIAGTLTGTLAAMLYVPFLPALAASLAAMLAEAGELRIADHHVDDNLLIPVTAGIVLWVIGLAIPF